MSALARLYGVEGELSEVARRGSGSACRSMLGGFVEWQRGERPDGRDSLAHQVAPETHWPELRVLVLVVRGWGRGMPVPTHTPRRGSGDPPQWVWGLGGGPCPTVCAPPQVSGEKKQVGSTAGMQTSVDTSPLLKVRAGGPDPAPACWQGLGSHFPWGGHTHSSLLGGLRLQCRPSEAQRVAAPWVPLNWGDRDPACRGSTGQRWWCRSAWP